jgi:hypothetical protein
MDARSAAALEQPLGGKLVEEIASSPAKVRIDGNRLSAGIEPPRIRSRSWSQSWRCSGTASVARNKTRSRG